VKHDAVQTSPKLLQDQPARRGFRVSVVLQNRGEVAWITIEDFAEPTPPFPGLRDQLLPSDLVLKAKRRSYRPTVEEFGNTSTSSEVQVPEEPTADTKEHF